MFYKVDNQIWPVETKVHRRNENNKARSETNTDGAVEEITGCGNVGPATVLKPRYAARGTQRRQAYHRKRGRL